MKEHLKGNAKGCNKITFMKQNKAKEVVKLNEFEEELLMMLQWLHPHWQYNLFFTQASKYAFLTPDPETVAKKGEGKQPQQDENDGPGKELKGRE